MVHITGVVVSGVRSGGPVTLVPSLSRGSLDMRLCVISFCKESAPCGPCLSMVFLLLLSQVCFVPKVEWLMMPMMVIMGFGQEREVVHDYVLQALAWFRGVEHQEDGNGCV